ncbi:unnamed protein product [Prorocentrum cordatum]|uniref:Uncharacterized protein n=1 Tax=Prorocentrum cordatum TaxID=2364126 RepID=A0ABN9XR92_9DINO|nr:unnamed protein product [Polarella glacialis]
MTLGSSVASRISRSSARSPLPLLALPTGADPSTVADDVRLQLRLPHLAQQRQSPLPLLAFLARADPNAAAMTSGSSFISRISPSSARARCHCSPFSHALIPAL